MHINKIRYNEKLLDSKKWNKIIAIDFDATIHKHITSNFDWEVIADGPIYGARTALDKLKQSNWYIIIHTARNINKKTLSSIKNWLKKFNIPFDEIWDSKSKPYADLYVDDRAIQFNGNWDDTLNDIENYKNWRNF